MTPSSVGRQGTPSSGETRALGAGLLTVVMWGSAFVGIRALAGELSPGSIVVGRLLAATAVFAVIAIVRQPRPALRRRDAVLAGAFGILWFGCYTFALSAGERLVDAGTAVLIVNVGPILIAVLAGVFLREGLPGRLLAGCAIALAGTVLVAASLTGSASFGGPAEGLLLCLAATFAYAVGATVQRVALRRAPAAWVNLIGAVSATLAVLPLVPGLVVELRSTDIAGWLWLGYLGVFPTAVGFSTWGYALARTSAGRAAAVNYLVPLVAIALSWLLLAEVPQSLALLGGALSIGGVVVARSNGASRGSWLRRAQATRHEEKGA